MGLVVLTDVLGWVVVLIFVLGGFCLLGLVVPLRPFGSRRRAAQWLLVASGALLATSVSMAAVAPPAAERKAAEAAAEDAEEAEVAAAEEVVEDDAAEVADAGDAADESAAAPVTGLVTLLEALTLPHDLPEEAAEASLPAAEAEPGAMAAVPMIDDLLGAVRDALGPSRGSGPDLRFPDSAFNWTSATRDHRVAIVEIVNRIALQHEGCRDPDPRSVARSAHGSAEAPVFIVTCGRGHDSFRIRFRPEDAAGGRVFAAVRAMEPAEALAACAAVARARGVPPVRFSDEPALTYVNEKSGLARIQSSFAAGGEPGQAFDIDCLFEGDEIVEATIKPRAG